MGRKMQDEGDITKDVDSNEPYIIPGSDEDITAHISVLFGKATFAMLEASNKNSHWTKVAESKTANPNLIQVLKYKGNSQKWYKLRRTDSGEVSFNIHGNWEVIS